MNYELHIQPSGYRINILRDRAEIDFLQARVFKDDFQVGWRPYDRGGCQPWHHKLGAELNGCHWTGHHQVALFIQIQTGINITPLPFWKLNQFSSDKRLPFSLKGLQV